MKTLIVYYSYTKNNEKLANFIKSKLNCDILELKETKKRRVFTFILDIVFKRKSKLVSDNIATKNYNNIIFVSPIWAGYISAPLKSFIESEKNNIKRYSFISLCCGADDPKQKLLSSLTKMIKKPPTQIKQIAVTNFLTEEEQKHMKNYMGFRLNPGDLSLVENDIDTFIKNI